jgi:hypothetical protein
MVIEATISHNGLIWAVVPEDDLPSLVSVLSGGPGMVQFSVDRDDRSEEWRVPKAMLVEPSDDDKLHFGLDGRMLVLRGRSSALAELASALSDLAADPAGDVRGMRQLRLVGFPAVPVPSWSWYEPGEPPREGTSSA